MSNLLTIYSIIGWMWFCGSVYSYTLTCSSDFKMIIRYLIFCLIAWPYMLSKVVKPKKDS